MRSISLLSQWSFSVLNALFLRVTFHYILVHRAGVFQHVTTAVTALSPGQEWLWEAEEPFQLPRQVLWLLPTVQPCLAWGCLMEGALVLPPQTRHYTSLGGTFFLTLLHRLWETKAVRTFRHMHLCTTAVGINKDKRNTAKLCQTGTLSLKVTQVSVYSYCWRSFPPFQLLTIFSPWLV